MVQAYLACEDYLVQKKWWEPTKIWKLVVHISHAVGPGPQSVEEAYFKKASQRNGG